MRGRAASAAAVAIAIATTARAAHARAAFASPDGGQVESVDLLAGQVEIEADHVAEKLATHVCDEACRALASMRRAADRLCAIEPGERCTRARARCEEAALKVREACPECAVAAVPDRERERAVAAAESPKVESTSGRRGCASCATAEGGGASDALGALLTALAVVAVQRRARRRRA